MKFIIGTKQQMTQLYVNGEMVPVTKVSCDKMMITQIKTRDHDGYSAVQFGYQETKKPLGKSVLGRLKNLPTFRRFKEVRIKQDEEGSFQVGDPVHVSGFEVGEKVYVTGTSKGRGFTGVVKRHGFSGGNKTHGNKDQLRMPGSIGAQGPQHVFKGTKMAGRSGHEQVTIAGLEIVSIDEATNTLFIKGALPGHLKSVVLVRAQGAMDMAKMKETFEKATKPEAPKQDASKEEKKEEGKTQEAPKEDVKEEKKEDVVEEKKDEVKAEETHAKEEPVKEEKKEEKPVEEKKEDKKES